MESGIMEDEVPIGQMEYGLETSLRDGQWLPNA
jgi:hypothetical protein